MLGNIPATEVVDDRATSTKFAITFPTKDHMHGRDHAKKFHLTADHLLKSLNVKTADLIGNDVSITVHAPHVAQQTNAHYGVMLHTGEHGDNMLDTPARCIATDAATGDSYAYHYVHVPSNGFGDVTLPVRPTAASMANVTDKHLAWKRAARWLKKPAEAGVPFELLKPEDVDAGVTKATLGDVTKYIVPKRSAVHRLITNSHASDKPEAFMEGNYTVKNAKTATANGETGYVMTEAHFNLAANTLKQSLDMAGAYPLSEGLHLSIEKLNDAPNPTSITLPLTITRTPFEHPVDPTSTAPVTIADVEHTLSTTAIGKAAKPTSFEADAFGAKTAIGKATLTRLVSEEDEV